MGESLETEEELIAATNFLRQKGARNVLVSLGGEGAMLLAENGEIYRQAAFKVKAINTVGSGDSMIAGFLAGHKKGCEYALKLGAAAGAATAALPRRTAGNIWRNSIIRWISSPEARNPRQNSLPVPMKRWRRRVFAVKARKKCLKRIPAFTIPMRVTACLRTPKAILTSKE